MEDRDDTERFLDWLAGFIDGEGCFIIGAGDAIRFRCCIALRDDDSDAIRYIHRKLGFGSIYHQKAQKGAPLLGWHVNGPKNCTKLATLLNDRLRTKKRRDFLIWSAALEAKAAGAGFQTLRSYKEALEAGRRYRAKRQRVECPTYPQLRLIRENEDATSICG